MKFRLMGESFKLSITRCNLAPGLISEEYAESDEYLQSVCDCLEDFHHPITLYITLTKRPLAFYDKSKKVELCDHALKYIHRFMAFSFSGRKDRVLTESDIFLSMVYAK